MESASFYISLFCSRDQQEYSSLNAALQTKAHIDSLYNRPDDNGAELPTLLSITSENSSENVRTTNNDVIYNIETAEALQ